MILNGDAPDNDDIVNPDNMDASSKVLVIQEDRESAFRNNPSRVQVYRFSSQSLLTAAQVIKPGTATTFQWESSGVIDVSHLLGKDWVAGGRAGARPAGRSAAGPEPRTELVGGRGRAAARDQDPEHRERQPEQERLGLSEAETAGRGPASTGPAWFHLAAVLVSRGRRVGPLDDREPQPIEDPVERRYAVRETRVRLHQGRFRGLVVRAYRDRCSICRLQEVRLLDAAHIVRDLDPRREPVVPNGLSL